MRSNRLGVMTFYPLSSEHQATATVVRTLEPTPRAGALIKIYMRQSAVRAMNLIQYKVCVGQKGSLSDKSVLT
jgi:hypothetical protein